MQATATMTISKRRKLFPVAAAAAIGLLATVSVIAFVNWNSGSESEAAQRPAVSAASQAAVNARFQAINELPVAASVARPAALNYRFLDMNVLPEAAIADGALGGQALTRFLEWNLILPGSDSGDYYPANDRDGQPN
jgi:hypothetical protein